MSLGVTGQVFSIFEKNTQNWHFWPRVGCSCEKSKFEKPVLKNVFFVLPGTQSNGKNVF